MIFLWCKGAINYSMWDSLDARDIPDSSELYYACLVGRKCPQIVLKRSISKKICFYVSNAHLKMMLKI